MATLGRGQSRLPTMASRARMFLGGLDKVAGEPAQGGFTSVWATKGTDSYVTIQELLKSIPVAEIPRLIRARFSMPLNHSP